MRATARVDQTRLLAVASRSSQSLSSCRSAGDRTLGASVSSARSPFTTAIPTVLGSSTLLCEPNEETGRLRP
jgi:hypothetical protein